MTVAVNIHGKDMEVSPRLTEYVEKKVGKLDKYLPTIQEARVDLTEIRSARSAADRFVAQLTIPARGAVLRAEERSDDVFAAIDAVMGKMYRQIERYKGKRYRGRGDGAGVETLAAEAAPVELLEEEEPTGEVVRRKSFVLMPMNEAEAIEQMQLSGHNSFFVFFNAELNRVNVLYRRRGGDLGLLDPELG